MTQIKPLVKRFIYASQKRKAIFHRFSFPVIQRYLKLKTWWFYGRYYSAEIDPTRIIWIDPDNINYHTSRNFEIKDFKMTHVIGGNWDIEPRRWDNYYLHQSFRHHFNDGLPWEETEFFNQIKQGIESGGRTYHRCETIDDLNKRLSYIDELYGKIRDEGYKSQVEIVKDKPSLGSYFLDEICISIGREGQFISEDGRHRLSIAKIVGIDRVPVRVLIRHKQWQKLRDSVAEPDNLKNIPEQSTDYLQHPDVSYIISD